MNGHEPPSDGLPELLRKAYAAAPDPRFAADLFDQLSAELPAPRPRWRPTWRLSPRYLVYGPLAAALLLVLGVCYVPRLFAVNPPPITIDLVNKPDQAPDAIRLLGAAGKVDTVASYLSCANDKIAAAAAITLGQVGDDKAARYLEAGLRTDDRPEVRPALFVALGDTRPDVKIDPAPALEALKDLSAPVEVRAAAIQLLSRKEVYRSLPDLLTALRDKSPMIRAKAYDAITHIIHREYGFRANAPEPDRNNILRVITADIGRIDWSSSGLPD